MYVYTHMYTGVSREGRLPPVSSRMEKRRRSTTAKVYNILASLSCADWLCHDCVSSVCSPCQCPVSCFKCHKQNTPNSCTPSRDKKHAGYDLSRTREPSRRLSQFSKTVTIVVIIVIITVVVTIIVFIIMITSVKQLLTLAEQSEHAAPEKTNYRRTA